MRFSRVDNGAMESTRSGWVSYTGGPGGKDHLPPEIRATLEQREAQRGSLLCSVTVMVYENEANASVEFPPPAAFDVETPPEQIAAAVRRAKDALEEWR
jgi:hypothetical protein